VVIGLFGGITSKVMAKRMGGREAGILREPSPIMP